MNNLRLFILGSTAVGKTKLSLELAPLLSAQIVSADSMQLYKQADILTGKVRREDRVVPHHMLDQLQTCHQGFNRNVFFEKGMTAIKDVQSRGLNTVVVGGTNYYVQSLLYKQNIDQSALYAEALSSLDSLTPSQVRSLLSQKDPLLANKAHPNDHRRLKNYLALALSEQSPGERLQDLGCQELRHQNSAILWMRCTQQQEMKRRVNDRVKEMLSLQGQAEVLAIHLSNPIGLLQSIGYKEFRQFFQQARNIVHDLPKQNVAMNKSIILKRLRSHSDRFAQSISKGKALLQESTLHLIKRQNKWIRRKIAGNRNQLQINQRLFLMSYKDSGELERLEKKLFEIVKKSSPSKLVQSLNQNKQFKIGQDELKKILENNQRRAPKDLEVQECELCGQFLRGAGQIRAHLNSRHHKKRALL